MGQAGAPSQLIYDVMLQLKIRRLHGRLRENGMMMSLRLASDYAAIGQRFIATMSAIASRGPLFRTGALTTGRQPAGTGNPRQAGGLSPTSPTPSSGQIVPHRFRER